MKGFLQYTLTHCPHNLCRILTVCAVAALCFSPVSSAFANDPFRPDPLTGSIPKPKGEVLDQPLCFNLYNKAPYKVFGSVMTDKYTTDEGVSAHHRSNFRLESGEKTDFCAKGPFFEGRKLELTIRTLLPIFSCKTTINEDVFIYGKINDDGTTKTWATCH